MIHKISRAIKTYEEVHGNQKIELIGETTMGCVKARVPSWNVRELIGTLVEEHNDRAHFSLEDDIEPYTRLNVLINKYKIEDQDPNYEEMVMKAIEQGTNLKNFTAEPLLPIKTVDSDVTCYLKIDKQLATNLIKRNPEKRITILGVVLLPGCIVGVRSRYPKKVD